MSEAHVPTAGQTIGPFYGYALPYERGEQVVPPSHPAAVRLHGTVRDGRGDPVPDALLEVWQADADGRPGTAEGALRRDGWDFTGFARTAVDAVGRYSFTTVVPGAPAGRLPSISMTVFARGLLDRLFTRVHLPVEGLAPDDDPFLATVPAERRSTLVAVPDERGYRFDVHLQGEQETVFLTFPRHPAVPGEGS